MKKTLLFILSLLFGFATMTNAQIVLNWTEPSAGSTYSTAEAEGNVSFVFNDCISDLKASGIYIVLPGGEKVEVIDYTFTDAFYTIFICHIGSQMEALYEEGKVKQGDEFKVRMEGVQIESTGETYGTDGSCEVALLMGSKPTELASTSVPWEGTIPAFSKVDPSSEEGKVTFTFTDPVAVEEASYSTGSVEDGTRVEISLPFTVDGCTVTVNLQGIPLDPASLGVSDYFTFGSIKLSRVTRVSDGTLVKGGQGSQGTISLYVNISETLNESIYGGFECANIDTEDNLLLYASEKFFFDELTFSYTVGGDSTTVSLSCDNFEGVDLGEDGYEYRVPLADFNFDAGEVKVSVSNPRSAYNQEFNFQPHTYVSEGRKAAAPKVLVAEPKENEISSFMPYVNLIFNEAVSIESAELSNADTKAVYQLHELEGSTIEATGTQVYISAGFNEYGHMTLRLRAKNAEGAYVTYGDTEGYVTLNYHVRQNALYFASSEPSEDAEADSLKTISLVFESTTEEDVIGGFALNACARLLTLQGKEVTKGRLAFDPNNYLGVIVTLDSVITTPGAYVLMIDEKQIFNNGFNSGDENYGVGLEGWDALYNMLVSVRLTVKPANSEEAAFVFTPGEEEVDSIASITIDYAEGIVPAYFGSAIVCNAAGEEVAKVGDPEMVIPEEEANNWDYIPTRLILPLDKPICRKGTYTLTISEGYFMLGTAYENSPLITATFNVLGTPSGIKAVVSSAVCEADAPVYNLSGVCVGKAENISMLPAGIYVLNGKKVIVK